MTEKRLPGQTGPALPAVPVQHESGEHLLPDQAGEEPLAWARVPVWGVRVGGVDREPVEGEGRGRLAEEPDRLRPEHPVKPDEGVGETGRPEGRVPGPHLGQDPVRDGPVLRSCDHVPPGLQHVSHRTPFVIFQG